jgi:hypothetical protein
MPNPVPVKLSPNIHQNKILKLNLLFKCGPSGTGFLTAAVHEISKKMHVFQISFVGTNLGKGRFLRTL